MKTNLKALCTGAVLVALATVLSFLKLPLPAWSYGGSITLGSMVPIILFALLFGTKWGLIGSVAYSLIPMMLGFYPPPTNTVWAFFLVIMLDYVVAFGGLGLADLFRKPFGKLKPALSATLAGSAVVILRFLCHFASGILIWDVYAPEGTPVWLYSFLYNGGYMAGELIITVVLMLLLAPSVLKIAKK